MMFSNMRQVFNRLAMVSIAIGIASGLLSSCKDNDDSYQKPSVMITPTPTDNMIQFGVEGGEQKLTIDSNRPWSVLSNTSWLAVDPAKGGAGKHTITVKALPNTSAARTTQITLLAGQTKLAYSVSQEGKEGASESTTHTILKDFLAKHSGKTPVEVIAEEDVLEVTVLTDATHKNQLNPGLYQVQEGDTGLVVYLPKGVNPKVGEVIRIKVKGARLGQYINSKKKAVGKIQLSILKKDMVELTGRIAPITPKVITLDDVLAGKYDNLLVAIDDVQFTKTEGTLYQLNNPSYFHRVTDCKERPNVKNSLSVVVYKNATFGTESIPQKRGRMVGILDLVPENNNPSQIKYYNLLIRSMSDLQLTKERCEGEKKKDDEKKEDGNKDEGNKDDNKNNEGVDTPTEAKLFISAYVEGTKGSEKYIQLYNPSDKEVDLKDYVLKMDNFSKGSSKGTKELSLEGKLAPKSIITYRNSNAKLYLKATPDSKGVINFNGDDNIALFYKNDLVDLVGMPFGTEWKGGSYGGGADIVLQRKISISKPNKTFTESEWLKTPYNEFITKDATLSFLGEVPKAK